MKTIEEIILDYTKGEKDLTETNEALKEAGSDLYLNPDRNKLTEEEKRSTTVGYYPDQANGYGLMDHGVGCLEKVHVVDGRTVDVDMGQETAYVYIGGRRYRLRGDVLTEED